MVFTCLSFKNVTFALQPFAALKPGANTGVIKSTAEEDITLLQLLSDLIDMKLNGEGHDVFNCKIDKQQPGTQQVRFSNNTIKTSFEYNYKTATATALQHLTDCNRKFSVPAHYHFLFRLTPF